MRRTLRPFRSLLGAARAPTSTSSPMLLSSRAFASSTGSRVKSVQELPNERAVAVTWDDGFAAKFHKLWLRDHCTCPACLHPETKQRQIDTASIPLDPACHDVKVSDNGNMAIAWESSVRGTTCRASEFDAQWLRDNAYARDANPYPLNHHQQTLTTRTLWDGSLEIPKHDFAETMRDLKPAMQDLHKYGLVMVTNTPSSMDETEAFSRKIGFVLRTIYGEMWTTNPQTEDQEYNDTASTNMELLHHTDGTYMRDPPGLQIFNCVAQAGEGGESRYIDAFHVIEKLRAQNPAAYGFLSTTPLNYHHFDNDAHLATMEPIIRVDHADNVVQFRHNDYDRAPLTHLSFDDVQRFYEYHRELMTIIRDPAMEATVKLRVGEMIVVDNQRVMHGRNAFDGGDRALIGSYIGRNEYDSRLRVLGII
ncbi:Trimethyllysine dioxygenase, partial [Globisporangium splendens]